MNRMHSATNSLPLDVADGKRPWIFSSRTPGISISALGSRTIEKEYGVSKTPFGRGK